MNDAKKMHCSCCEELISKSALVCYHCGRNQKFLIRCLAPTLQGLGLLVSAVLLMFSWGQFNEARRQRQSADAALIRANATEARVSKIAKTTIPVFESLLNATGRLDMSFSSKDIENLTKPLKEAIAENKDNSRVKP